MSVRVSLLSSLPPISEGCPPLFHHNQGGYCLCSSWSSYLLPGAPELLLFSYLFLTTTGTNLSQSNSCYCVFGTLLLTVGSWLGAGVPGSYFPPSAWGRKEACLAASLPLSAYIPLFSLGLGACEEAKQGS